MDQESDQRSFLQKHKFTLISLFIILLAAIPLIIFSNSESQKHPAIQKTIQSVSPTATPLTTNNVEPTLTQTNAEIQGAMTRLDTDIKASQVDTSQDTTTGL